MGRLRVSRMRSVGRAVRCAPRGWRAVSSCPEIVASLDKHIVGQTEAKRALAVALRDRWRRKQIPDDALRAEVFPNNILMSGPTGTGKTECARRLSKIVGAPFVRCEATRFTEIGIVGSSPEIMVKDLADEAVTLELAKAEAQVQEEAHKQAEMRVVDHLYKQSESDAFMSDVTAASGEAGESHVIQVPPENDSSPLNAQEAKLLIQGLSEQDIEVLWRSLPRDQLPVHMQDLDRLKQALEGLKSTIGIIPDDQLEQGLRQLQMILNDEAWAAIRQLKANQQPPSPPKRTKASIAAPPGPTAAEVEQQKEAMLKQLQNGMLDAVEVNVRVQPPSSKKATLGLGGGGDEMTEMHDSLKNMMGQMMAQGGDRPTAKQLTVAEWLPLVAQEIADDLIDMEQVVSAGLASCEQDGIIFVDEVDKLAAKGSGAGGSSQWAKGEGVQKELLGLLEGTVVKTRHGLVNTEHVLFIAAGAFHGVKPSDLLPELQGRLAVRVQLQPLNSGDLLKIVTQTRHNLFDQQIALMATEGIELEFTDCAAKAVADAASEANRTMENIGARRLRTIISKVMEELKFEASAPGKVTIDAEYVQDRLGSIMKKADMSRYVL